MRELGFRVLDKETNDYGLSDFLLLDSNGKLMFFNFAGDSVKIQYVNQKNFVVEHATGVLDKNGKMIYEGDIVSKHNSDLKGVVKQVKDGQWAIYWDNTPDGYYVLFKYSNLCEVIGNIHEDNPNEKE